MTRDEAKAILRAISDLLIKEGFEQVMVCGDALLKDGTLHWCFEGEISNDGLEQIGSTLFRCAQ